MYNICQRLNPTGLERSIGYRMRCLEFYILENSNKYTLRIKGLGGWDTDKFRFPYDKALSCRRITSSFIEYSSYKRGI